MLRQHQLRSYFFSDRFCEAHWESDFVSLPGLSCLALWSTTRESTAAAAVTGHFKVLRAQSRHDHAALYPLPPVNNPYRFERVNCPNGLKTLHLRTLEYPGAYWQSCCTVPSSEGRQQTRAALGGFTNVSAASPLKP